MIFNVKRRGGLVYRPPQQDLTSRERRFHMVREALALEGLRLVLVEPNPSLRIRDTRRLYAVLFADGRDCAARFYPRLTELLRDFFP